MLRASVDEGVGEEAPETGAVVLVPARTAWILTICILWSGLVCARLAQYMLFQRSQVVTLMEDEAWQVRTLPPLRGRILDRNGRPLAWSTRHFRAVLEPASDPAVARRRLSELDSAVPALGFAAVDLLPGQPVVLAEDPAPETLAELSRLAAAGDDLRVESVTRRHYIAHRGLRRRLGTVRITAASSCGLSGEEKRHDHLLRGSAGKFRVMVARDGSWVPGTWETLRELRPGYDVYLNVRVSPD